MTGGRVGSSIPLMSPATQERIDAGAGAAERRAMQPHDYEITSSQRRDGVLYVTARHRPTADIPQG